MAQGFIGEEADIAAIAAPAALAKIITLSASAAAAARDANVVLNPGGGYWSHLDIVLLQTAGGLTGASIVLTYDTAGDNVACVIPAADVSTAAALTTANTFLLTAKIDKWQRQPSVGTVGQIYAFVAPTGGATVTLKKMRLHWRDGHSGG